MQKEITQKFQDRFQEESLIRKNQCLEAELMTKQNEIFVLKETNFNLKRQINQLKEKNFEMSSFSEKKQAHHTQGPKLTRHFSEQIGLTSSPFDFQQVNILYKTGKRI